MNQPIRSLRVASCADDYDPNSMSVTKAREFIRTFLEPVKGLERITVRSALGRVLAADLVSPMMVPAHDNSAMDGYALRAADLSAEGDVTLKLIGTSYAGVPFGGTVGPGECVRIMTGAKIPQGSDTVVIQEHVETEGNTVRIGPGHRKGQNLRRAGEDVAVGQTVLRSGKSLRPADLGLAASLGIAELPVYRRLRVAFFSTGNELKSVGSVLEEGQIYDSNRYTIYGMLTRLGCEVIDMGVVRDDPTLIEKAFREASSMADVVITSGGVSVGEADFIREILGRLGEVLFWKIAMKPGRPLAYGKIGDAHFFGLPGNPVAVMMTFYQFVRDALLVLMGQSESAVFPTFQVLCVSPLKKAPGRTEFQRGVLFQEEGGEWRVRVTGEQGSGILSSMSEANCFIVLPEATGNLAPGTMVEVQLMEGMI